MSGNLEERAAAVKQLLDAMLSGQRRALARVLTLIEDEDPRLDAHDDRLWAAGAAAPRWGITGPPGAGKSTLVSALLRQLRGQGRQVAVLAVDPSSPFTGGAVLGDRIRMHEHADDPGVFIRSLATRGSRGGLARGTRRAAAACAAAGFDLVLVETAGVGQSEIAIMELADTVLVVLVPEAGDMVQGMKAGLLEVADLLAVNKADRPGADRMVQALSDGVRGARVRGREPPVLALSALEGTGVDALVEALLEHESWRSEHPAPARRAAVQVGQALEEWLGLHLARSVANPPPAFAALAAEVEAGRLGPRAAARRCLADEALRRELLGGSGAS
jgi:LAO/AO transport system kinase